MLSKRHRLITFTVLILIYMLLYCLHQFILNNNFLTDRDRNIIGVRKSYTDKDDDDDYDVVYDLIDGSDESELQKTLIFPYKYILDEPVVCDPDIKVINIVPVRASDRDVRDEVRNTRGSKAIVSSTKLKPIFLIGATQSLNEQQSLEAESNQYHDIIQVDFVDSYLNLTLKTLTAFHWKQSRCAQVPWLLKSDGDVFMNPWAVKELLMETDRDFVCRILTQRPVCRAVKNYCRNKRWVISRESYPHDKYPPYCNGPAYALNKRAVSQIINRAATRKMHFPMEDIYFTGVLAQGLGLHYYDIGARMRLYHLEWPPSNEMLVSGKVLYLVDSYKKSKGRYTHEDLWRQLITAKNRQ